MNTFVARSGNTGPKVRSDCEISLELRNEGGIVIDLESRVKVLYGESIRLQCVEILNHFGLTDAYLKINDSGALPFVIAARLESSIKQLISSDLEFLPAFSEENRFPTTRDRFRFTRLYIPGNTPALMINAGLHSSDGIILDLEDSVAPEKKAEARILVRNALRQISFNGAERMVRINQGDAGLTDLDCLVPQNVNLVLIPKCETPEAVKVVSARINEISTKCNLPDPVYLMPIIESALGVENAFEIARSSPDVVAMAVGLEDLTADLGVQRSAEGKESLYARTRVVNAAKAARIQPIDSVFSDVDDTELLRQTVAASKALGFEGMGCIHPRQIAIVRDGFAPGREEIERSARIVVAFEEARKNGLGVVALGTKMIDQPVVTRAQKTIGLAVKLGLLSPDWNEKISSD